MRRSLLLLSLTLIAIMPVAARAALLGDASIAYSAERTVTVNGSSYAGMVFHVPGHERDEHQIHGIAEVFILDAATKRAFLVVPMLKSYVAFSFPGLMAELDSPDLRRNPVGKETVNGMRTTKYRIDHVSSDGTRAQGFAWLSAQGVLMRIDGTITRRRGGKPLAIRMELANVAVGPQDPALFRVPSGFTELPTQALQGLFGSKPG
jgi:hypothetical protein